MIVVFSLLKRQYVIMNDLFKIDYKKTISLYKNNKIYLDICLKLAKMLSSEAI